MHDLREKSAFSKILSKKAQNFVLNSPKYNRLSVKFWVKKLRIVY